MSKMKLGRAAFEWAKGRRLDGTETFTHEGRRFDVVKTGTDLELYAVVEGAKPAASKPARFALSLFALLAVVAVCSGCGGNQCPPERLPYGETSC